MSVSELQNSSSVKLCSKDRQLAARVPHAAPDHAEWPFDYIFGKNKNLQTS